MTRSSRLAPSQPQDGGRRFDGSRGDRREIVDEGREVQLVPESGGELWTISSASYLARWNRRSTARWTRVRNGLKSAATRSVDAATAMPSLLTRGLTWDTSTTLTPAKTANRTMVTTPYPIALLTMRSMS